METFNQDPKPGRLVLPLVLIGMIATTYTFVNRVATNNDLDVSVVEEEVTTEEEATEDVMVMAGASSEELVYGSDFFRIALFRLPWLVSSLVGSLVTTPAPALPCRC